MLPGSSADGHQARDKASRLMRLGRIYAWNQRQRAFGRLLQAVHQGASGCCRSPCAHSPEEDLVNQHWVRESEFVSTPWPVCAPPFLGAFSTIGTRPVFSSGPDVGAPSPVLRFPRTAFGRWSDRDLDRLLGSRRQRRRAVPGRRGEPSCADVLCPTRIRAARDERPVTRGAVRPNTSICTSSCADARSPLHGV